ncbi:PKD domain-containing protein [Pelomonas sp. V22]|uniref:PKD domain-containing protein n=1 Tax=Pelomonas sp. V22 TaxID=2822139 RepID=UPI0024A7C5A7|nr:PKD domain-containing protein [Pelomonas sp. V22]MDI4635337.1 PKD domain-containing protein [Pelomonas sp. V22]
MLVALLGACGGGGAGSGSGSGIGTSPGPDITPTPVVAPGASIVAVVTSPALVGDTVKFTGVPTGSRSPLSLDWDFGDGGVATAGTAVEHSYAAAGTYRVTFRVTDAAGVRATATTSVVIEPRTGLSIATDRNDYTVGQTVRLSPSGDYRNAKTYDWDFGDGRRASGPEAEVAYAALGQHTVTLVATYEQGFQRKAQATVGVSTNTPTFALSAPAVIYPLRAASLTATPGSEVGGRTDWNFGDGSSLAQGAADVPHTYARSGTYQVTATRTNKTGFQYTATMSITVLPPPPPSGLTLESAQLQVLPGQSSAEVSFVGRVANDAGDLGTLYTWDFGDGSRSSQSAVPSASHTYASAGSYVVTLTATNSYGLSATGTATVSIGPRQVLKLLAGQGVTGTLIDGPALSARFLRPEVMSFDADGNLFISDHGNGVVRKLSAQGEVSTVQIPDGSGLEKSGSARYFQVAAFGSGELIASGYDGNSTSFVRVNPDGSSVPDNRFSPVPYVTAFARAPSGAIAIAAGVQIWLLEPNGKLAVLAGDRLSSGNIDGPGWAARFAYIRQMGFDAAGTLYVADRTRIRKVAQDGTVTSLAGHFLIDSPRDGIGSDARLGVIDDFAVAPDGTVYMLSAESIRQINPSGEVRTLPISLQFPNRDASVTRGIALSPDGTLFVSDWNKGVIRRINGDGSLTTVAGREWISRRVDGQGAVAVFFQPTGIAQGPSGALYVADAGNRALRKVTLGGEVSTLAMFPGSDTVQFRKPLDPRSALLGGVAVDDQENVYVADTLMHVIRKVSPNGTSTVLAGLANTTGASDGVGTEARFDGPMGVAVDAARNVYVSDARNYLIRKITPAGKVTTLAGLVGKWGSSDGVGGDASFWFPTSLAAAPDGTLWVADRDNQLLRKITPDGAVTTVAGIRPDCYVDGPVGKTCIQYPLSLSYDASTGDVYVISSDGVERLRANGRYETLMPVGKHGRPVLGQLPAFVGEAYGVAVLSNGQIAVTSGNAVLITSFGP